MKKLRKNCLAKKSLYFLTNRKISDKEYELVLNVWIKSELKSMKDCHELYLKYDILLLVDVFEKIRSNILKNNDSCLSLYLSAPGWDAILKMKKIEL